MKERTLISMTYAVPAVGWLVVALVYFVVQILIMPVMSLILISLWVVSCNVKRIGDLLSHFVILSFAFESWKQPKPDRETTDPAVRDAMGFSPKVTPITVRRVARLPHSVAAPTAAIDQSSA